MTPRPKDLCSTISPLSNGAALLDDAAPCAEVGAFPDEEDAGDEREEREAWNADDGVLAPVLELRRPKSENAEGLSVFLPV